MEVFILPPTAALTCVPLQQKDQLPATQRYTKEEWEAQQGIIIGMYSLNMTLKNIVEFLYKERGFFVTDRQLRRKIAEWKIDKNVKGEEMKVIVRKQQHRRVNGKETEFRVRGQPVAQAKIDRWQKRTDHQSFTSKYLEDTSSPGSASSTPSAISYGTPNACESPLPFPMSPHVDSTEEAMHFPESSTPILTAVQESSTAHRSVQPMIRQDDEFQNPISDLLISQFQSLQDVMSDLVCGPGGLPAKVPYDANLKGDQSANWNFVNHCLWSKSYQLAYSLYLQGKRSEADAIMQAQVATRERMLGVNHEETVRFKLEIANIRKFWWIDVDQNNLDQAHQN